MTCWPFFLDVHDVTTICRVCCCSQQCMVVRVCKDFTSLTSIDCLCFCDFGIMLCSLSECIILLHTGQRQCLAIWRAGHAMNDL